MKRRYISVLCDGVLIASLEGYCFWVVLVRAAQPAGWYCVPSNSLYGNDEGECRIRRVFPVSAYYFVP